jgi:hypothetical protein
MKKIKTNFKITIKYKKLFLKNKFLKNKENKNKKIFFKKFFKILKRKKLNNNSK